MTEISEAHKRQSKRTAAAAVAVVAVLSLAFIGLVSFLDNAAGQVQTDSVSIEAVSSSEPFYTLLIGSDSRRARRSTRVRKPTMPRSTSTPTS